MSLCSNLIFRGIAQLVEQRSPNVNAATIIRINAELSRLGTSVSSLFLLQGGKVIYAKTRSELAKNPETSSKDQHLSNSRKRMTDTFLSY